MKTNSNDTSDYRYPTEEGDKGLRRRTQSRQTGQPNDEEGTRELMAGGSRK